MKSIDDMKPENLDKAMDLIDTENGNRDFNKPTNISDSIDDIPVNVPPKKEERSEGTVTVEKAAVKIALCMTPWARRQ